MDIIHHPLTMTMISESTVTPAPCGVPGFGGMSFTAVSVGFASVDCAMRMTSIRYINIGVPTAFSSSRCSTPGVMEVAVAVVVLFVIVVAAVCSHPRWREA